MKFIPTDPPREFEVGCGAVIKIKDCAHIELKPDEQVTFLTSSGAEYDVARKSWGFYATPSLNGRLRQFGWRAALVKSPAAKYYVFLVESDKQADFQHYLDVENHQVICWLDQDATLTMIESSLKSE